MQSKKWHVLIVDDEFRIGTLIKKLIHWDELNLDCIRIKSFVCSKTLVGSS